MVVPISVVDIPLFKVSMSPRAARQVSETLMSGYIGQGPRVDEFEWKLAVYLQLDRRPVTTSSATHALDLALHLAGVEQGDIVISTPMTCTATNGVIARRGARILWADILPDGTIDAHSVKKLLEHHKARAIMAVDWSGKPPDIRSLRAVAEGIPIIQDAAHSFLPPGGDRGDYLVYSFQAIKFLTTGDGGLLVPPPEQEARARLLRWYGLDRESSADFRCAQNITEIGYKYHMNDIAATIGIHNLPLAAWAVQRSRENAQRILDGVYGSSYLSPDHSCWFLDIVTDRPELLDTVFTAEGIGHSKVHARNDKHTAFKAASLNPEESRWMTTWYDRQHWAIPCGHWLSDDDVDRIIEALKQVEG